MPDYLQLFQSFQSLHHFAERDKNLIFRSIEALALENRHPISHICQDIQGTFELEELIITTYLPKDHALHPLGKDPAIPIPLKETAFEQAPFHQKILVLSHLTRDWVIDGKNPDYQHVLWVPICVAGHFIGAMISRCKWPRQDLALIGEAILIIASTLGYHLKNEELQHKLTQERNKAEELAHVKSDFLAMMSHELRTPLNGVIGMTELLKEGELSSKQQEYANLILNSGESLLSLINDILDYSRMDAGKMLLDRVPFRPKKLIQEISSIFRHRLKNSAVDFILSCDDRIPEHLIGDPGRVKQILNNLLGNALKFTSKGSIHFHIKPLESHNPSKGDLDSITLRFEVADTGIGIARKNIDHIFESFSQENSEISKKYGGTGLGLAICSKLVRLMDGQINVQSILGKGSTFQADLSFHIAHQQHEHPQFKLKPLQNLQVLVVDDNPNVTQSIKHLLDSLKVKTDLAHGVDEAIDIIARAESNGIQFDAIITDRIMGQLDGFDFANALSQTPSAKDIPVIMMTSRGLRGDAQRAKMAGLSAFITKPIRKNLLKNVLQLVTDPSHKKSDGLVTKYSFENVEQDFKILIVDDNRINHKVIHNILSDEGYAHDFAHNGKEAIELAAQNSYQLVFMDIHMPVMDGLEATGHLRHSSPHYSQVPIVAMTAKLGSESESDFSEMGFDHCLPKPFKRDHFMQVVLKFNPPKPMVD